VSARVLVTGGAGFIGSHIVDALVDAEREVVVVDSLLGRSHHHVPAYLNSEAEYLWGDLRDATVMGDAIRGVDAVCHQAGVVGLEDSFAGVVAYVSNNDLGSAQLLSALHSAQWSGPLILASSMVVYGEGAYMCNVHGPARPRPRLEERLASGCFDVACPVCEGDLTPIPVDEGMPLDPRSIYAATKVHQEHLFAAFGRTHDVSVAKLRYHNVYGPRMPLKSSYAGVASIFRRALMDGQRPEVFEDGGQLRDFVHVRDVAAANLAAIEMAADGEFNIATGTPRSILDMALAMAGRIDPALSPRVTGAFRRGDVRHVFASPLRAQQTLGWRAQVDFDEGMRELAGTDRVAAQL
jgi:dTDP-L-rhamnose 4-epimerase